MSKNPEAANLNSEKTKDIRMTNIIAARGKITLNHYHKFNLHNLAVADVVRTSLGPRGMDKMVSNPYNLEFISNYKFIE
jgi:chaperonin GroEL (HSP60 family)